MSPLNTRRVTCVRNAHSLDSPPSMPFEPQHIRHPNFPSNTMLITVPTRLQTATGAAIHPAILMSAPVACSVPSVASIEALKLVFMLLTLIPLVPKPLVSVVGPRGWCLLWCWYGSRLRPSVHLSLCTIERSHEYNIRCRQWRGCLNGCNHWCACGHRHRRSLSDTGLGSVDDIAFIPERTVASLPLGHAQITKLMATTTTNWHVSNRLSDLNSWPT